MNIEITEPGFDAPVISIVNTVFGLRSQYGQGRFQCYQGKGFSFWNNNYRFSSDTILHARADIPVLELHITREGNWTGTWDGIDELMLSPAQFNLSYTPHVKTMAYFRKENNYRSCDIHFEKSYLQALAIDFPELDIFLQAVEKKEAGSLAPRNHYCSPEMIAATEAILDNPFGERVQPYILDIKVKEILLCALEKVAASAAAITISKAQQEALLFARQRIEASEDAPLTITELSKLAGLNEYILKKGFKSLFGVSPYQYHVELKMKKAKFLLLETTEPVAAVAYQLGYMQSSSFIHEFRKATGTSPLLWRKMGGK